jgi:hypothetical protein
VPDGSLTYGMYAKAKRILGHLEDLLASVTGSPKHFGAVAGEYAEAPEPDPGFDWIDDLGRTFDAMGDGTKSMYFKLEQFTESINIIC